MTRLTMPARDFLAQQRDESVGLVITDPPWRLSGSDHESMFSKVAPYPKQAVGAVASVLADAQRCLVPGGYLYLFMTGGPEITVLLNAMTLRGWNLQRLLCWYKGNQAGMGAWRNSWEPIAVFSNGIPRPYQERGRNQTMMAYPRPGTRTQKPWQLYRTFMRMSSKPGELVIDPYCGSNPLQAAAEALEPARRWMSCDILTAEEVTAQLQARPFSKRRPNPASSEAPPTTPLPEPSTTAPGSAP